MWENDVLTWGSVSDKWLSFKPVIFVLSLYRVISKQTCLDTSGLSEHAFTGNLYCLLSSWNRTDDYMSAPESFGSPCAFGFCRVLVVLAPLLHIPRARVTNRKVLLRLCECLRVGGGGRSVCVLYAVYGYAGSSLSRCFTTRLEKESSYMSHARTRTRTHKHTPAYFFHIPHVRRSVIGCSSKWLERHFFSPVRSFNWLFTG